jgi:hypothetical protein
MFTKKRQMGGILQALLELYCAGAPLEYGANAEWASPVFLNGGNSCLEPGWVWHRTDS